MINIRAYNFRGERMSGNKCRPSSTRGEDDRKRGKIFKDRREIVMRAEAAARSQYQRQAARRLARARRQHATTISSVGQEGRREGVGAPTRSHYEGYGPSGWHSLWSASPKNRTASGSHCSTKKAARWARPAGPAEVRAQGRHRDRNAKNWTRTKLMMWRDAGAAT